MVKRPSSRPEAIEQILRRRCGKEFPGVTWEEMDATVAASSMSEEEPNFECDQGTDKVVAEAVQFRRFQRWKLDSCSYEELIATFEEEHLIYTAFLGNYDETTLQEFTFFNRPESDANLDHWLKMHHWTPEEAVSLSFGKEPTRINKESLEQVVGFSSFVGRYQQRLDQVVRAIDAGQLGRKITPESLIQWITRTGIECSTDLAELVKSGAPLSQEDAPDNRELGFASFKDLVWTEVTLVLLSSGHIAASARNLTKKVPLADLGLLNRTTNQPKRSFELLASLAKSRQSAVRAKPALKDIAYELRKNLRSYFGIASNPLPTLEKHYIPRFQLIDKRDAPDKRAKEKALRRTVAFDESKLSHQRSSEIVSTSDLDEYPHDDETDETAEWIEGNSN